MYHPPSQGVYESEKGQTSPLRPVEYEVYRLGGTPSVLDFSKERVQADKMRISHQELIEELTRQNGRIREELDYYRRLADEVLHPLLSDVASCLQLLRQAAERCYAVKQF